MQRDLLDTKPPTNLATLQCLVVPTNLSANSPELSKRTTRRFGAIRGVTGTIGYFGGGLHAAQRVRLFNMGFNVCHQQIGNSDRSTTFPGSFAKVDGQRFCWSY
jgi:hypothetical protein